MPSLHWARSFCLLLRLVEVDAQTATAEKPTEESTEAAHFERWLNKLLSVEVCMKRVERTSNCLRIARLPPGQ